MVVDSYQKKEIKKHINFIPCRKKILSFLKISKDLINQKKLEKKFNLNNQEDKKALRQKLREMERDGQIVYAQNRYYITLENLKIVTGKVIGHRDGYGFLRTEKFKDDFWLSIEQMKLCIHGDIILAHILTSDRKRRNSAKVLKILQPNNILIVGRYCINNKKKFVIPNDSRFNFKIFIFNSFSSYKSIPIGTIVVVKVQHNFSKKNKIRGKIVEILGKEMGIDLCINIALRTYSIPHLWSKEVKSELCQIKNGIDPKDLKNRLDLRHIPFFTIDEKDARDFDDAVFCKKKK